MYLVGFTHPNGSIDVLGFAENSDDAADMVDACVQDMIYKTDGETRALNRFTIPEFNGSYIITESTTHVELRRKTTTTIDSNGWFQNKSIQENDQSIGWVTAAIIDEESLRKESCWPSCVHAAPRAPVVRKAMPSRPPQPWMNELHERIRNKIKDE